MHLRLALFLIACTSCVAPVTQPGSGVYTPEIETIELIHASGWLPPPPGGTNDFCGQGATFTVTVSSHVLAWNMCVGTTWVTDSRVLDASEWTALESQLDELVVIESGDCPSDGDSIGLTVTNHRGGTQVYGDSGAACNDTSLPLIQTETLHAAEAALRKIALGT